MMSERDDDITIRDANGLIVDAGRRSKIVDANRDLLPPVGRVGAITQELTIEVDETDRIVCMIVKVRRQSEP